MVDVLSVYATVGFDGPLALLVPMNLPNHVWEGVQLYRRCQNAFVIADREKEARKNG